ncbi:hypothetical protein NJB1604_45180 [Mycobacterium marinum]|uniref:DUF2971 domain-containing protein n=1 Tax=Mycobacterium marinum TaxID=1781 RepID=UPI0021C47F86|nr:DUF2971 domain-containing protein [Mycobacterium marinum]GJO54275.1 hypothetical protein NJB1604_45180 [Mycobacterium marinum]
MDANDSEEGRAEPGVLYHYTDAGAFAAIAEHRKLRATDIRFLNDPLELRYAWEDLFTALEAAKTSKPDYSEAYDAALQAISMVDAVNPEASEDRLFSVSFSERGDDLGQWRSYADDAKGMALGFDTDSIALLEVPYFHHSPEGKLIQMQAIISDTNQQVPFQWGSFTQPVAYGDEARQRAIDVVLWEIEQYCLKNGEGLLPNRLYTLINRVPIFLSKLALVKKKTYESEQEWRFTIPEHLGSSSLSMKKALGKIEEFKWAAQGALETVDVKFRPGGRAGLKPYTEIPFKTKALVRVVIGPNVESRRLALSTARQVLDRYGFRDTEVVPSEHTYRS